MAETMCMGVIGGLGPAATISFMSMVLARTPVERTGRHLHLIVDSNPGVPDINAAVLGRGPSPVEALQAMARRLETAGADFLVMACNAAHLYEDDIRRSVSIPFLSMIDATCAHIASTLPGARRAGLVATDGGIACGIYQRGLEARGLETLVPSPAETDTVMAAVARVRLGDLGPLAKTPLVERIDGLADAGAECVIAGCTEIPLVLTQRDVGVPLIDPAEILAEAAIAFAIREKSGQGLPG
ncbi:MAG: aspartate/glutamate racemase family protein [Mesorhizobium sp.]